MEDQQKQLVERLKESQNILVTVSKDPSVDQLAAAIALTIALNKLEKHGTAVFSGRIPNTLEFLKPEETLEKNTDSLRDFIIALDKSKADKLRYKVEDTVVRIFITPYKTSITDHDLDFSQGDFNVDVVVALGVTDQQDIDEAIQAHGRILDDATVASISANNPTEGQGGLGTINWVDGGMSSLSEMIVKLVQELEPTMLDSQIATALLTGIVAATDRFSNDRTTPQTMNISATLMAAGANPQLIAAQLAVPDTDTSAAPPVASEAEVPIDTSSESSPIEINHDTAASAETENSQGSQNTPEMPPADNRDMNVEAIGTDQPDMQLPEVNTENLTINHHLLSAPSPQSETVNLEHGGHNEQFEDTGELPSAAGKVPEVPLMSHNENIVPDEQSADPNKPVVVDLTTVPGPSMGAAPLTDTDQNTASAEPPGVVPELKLPEFEALASEPPDRPNTDFLAGTDNGTPMQAPSDNPQPMQPSSPEPTEEQPTPDSPVESARGAVDAAFGQEAVNDSPAAGDAGQTNAVPADAQASNPDQLTPTADSPAELPLLVNVEEPQYQPAPGFPQTTGQTDQTPTNPGFNEPSPGSSPADATLDMPMPQTPSDNTAYGGQPDVQPPIVNTFPGIPPAPQGVGSQAPPTMPPPIMPPVQ